MTIRLLKPEDIDALKNLLQPRIDTSLFLLSNLASSGLEPGTTPFCGQYYGRFKDEVLDAVVVQYWNSMVMMQGSEAGVVAIWEHCGHLFSRIKGFIGPDPLCQLLKKRYHQKFGSAVLAMDARDRLYALSLSQLKTPTLLLRNEFVVRVIQQKDLPILQDWMIDYEIHALHSKKSPELVATVGKELENRLETGSTFVLENNNGQLLATSSFNATYQNYVQIGAVWTPLEYRCNGYGRSVVAGSLQLAKEQGASKAILFTDEVNVSAISAYEHLGFEHIGEFGLYLY